MAKMNPVKVPVELVPTQSVSVTIEEVAMQIFVKSYMDTAGKTKIHLAEKSFEAAEAFVQVANSRRKS